MKKPIHEKHHALKPLEGLNSTVSETLVEIVNDLKSISDIRDVVEELDRDSMSLFEIVEKSGITNPRFFVQMFLAEEQEAALKVRKRLVNDLMKLKAGVLLPLPPYILDAILSVVPDNMIYNTEDKEPGHIKMFHFPKMKPHDVSDITRRFKGVSTMIIDGQRVKNKILIRANTAQVIEMLMTKNLKTIFIHRIPHLPPEQKFVTVDVGNSIELINI